MTRERSTGAYDTLSYFTAKYFVEAPLNLAPCVLFTCILYWMVGLNPDRFGYCILIMMYQVLAALSLGLWISCIAPSAEAASSLGLPAVIVSLLFAGYYINIESLPVIANWIPYFSFIRWSYAALAINEFKGETFTCGGGATGACLTTGMMALTLLFNSVGPIIILVDMFRRRSTFQSVFSRRYSRICMFWIRDGFVGIYRMCYCFASFLEIDFRGDRPCRKK